MSDSRFKGWHRPRLLKELRRLQDRRERVAMGKSQRTLEDAEIRELIDILRTR